MCTFGVRTSYVWISRMTSSLEIVWLLLNLLAIIFYQMIEGSRQWLKWRKELDIIAGFGYFSLTTISGFQTLGEEYVNIVQVDNTTRKVPSSPNRIFMILLHVVGPYILQKSLDWLEKDIRNTSSHRTDSNLETRQKLLDAIPVLRFYVTFLHRCHLAVFYVHGIFYHISKRLSGVQYIQIVTEAIDSSSNSTFKIIGWLSLVQLLGSILIQGYRFFSSRAPVQKTDCRVEPISETCDNPKLRCSLCLERRHVTTATPCGHLFCWKCIHEWSKSKLECPLCRERFLPQQLFSLKNYD